ncbi:MAG: hypothetical protein ACRD0G_06800, partial [Acidimicrobiales bacterium]
MTARVRQPETGPPEAVDVMACRLDGDDSDPGCEPGTEGALGEIRVDVRNRLARPDSLTRFAPGTPLWATIAGAGDAYELTARVTDVDQVRFAQREGVMGVRTGAGNGQDLVVLADLGGFDPNPFFPDAGGDLPLLDIAARAAVRSLPETFEFCLRQPDAPVGETGSSFTVACEDSAPFGDDDDELGTPLSVAYRGDDAFDLTAEAEVVVHDTEVDLDDLVAGPPPIDDVRYRARLSATDVPAEITAHVLAGPDDEPGLIRAVVDTGDGAPQVDIDDLLLARLDGDLECDDPRVPAAGFDAVCISGDLDNLPRTVDFRLDRDAPEHNLEVVTTGEQTMDLFDVLFTSVRGTGGGDADVLRIEAPEITGVPRSVTGTVDLPGTLVLEVPEPEPALGHVDVVVENFIGADPLAAIEVPAQRSTFDDPGTPLPEPTQFATFLQRGDRFRATADINDVRGVGYATTRDQAGNLLDTRTISVDFGQDQVIRAYADLEFLLDETDPSSAVSIIGDVTLEDVPAGIDLCFRGERTQPQLPVAPTWCDEAPADDEGSFRFAGDPEVDTAGLDVDAFVRFARSGGAEALVGRARIEDIPPVVRGTFSNAGTVLVEGYDATESDRVGIGRLAIDLANADVVDSGFAAPPWSGTVLSDTDPLLLVDQDQYVTLAAADLDFHVRGTIGVPEGSNQPGSAVERVRVGDEPCGPGPLPADFPHYPQNDGVSDYICVEADIGEASGQPDPLGLAAIVVAGDTRLVLDDAGLDDVPDSFSLTYATTPTLHSDGSLRRPCATAAGPGAEEPDEIGCMPPLLRFDTAEDAVLFGLLEVSSNQLGTQDDLDRLGSAEFDARQPLADVDAAPGEDGSGWPEWESPLGVRVHMATLDDEPGRRPVLRAGVRLGVPHALTLDQIQLWDDRGELEGGVPFAANDARFHYRVSDTLGNPVATLGQLAGLFHLADGSQLLVSEDGDDELAGVPIPGDVGIAFFRRTAPQSRQDLFQVDGRVNQPLSARLRMVGGPDSVLGVLDAAVRNVPAAEGDPLAVDPSINDASFRLRAELIRAEDDGGGQGCSVLLCMETDVQVPRVEAYFDFSPHGEGAAPARLVEAVIRLDKHRNGVQVRGYESVLGGEPADFGLYGAVEVDPLNFDFHAGIPVLGRIDVNLVSELEARIEAVANSDLLLRHNLVHLRADASDYAELRTQFNVLVFNTLVHSILGFFPFLGGNPILFGMTLPPMPLPLQYHECVTAGLAVDPVLDVLPFGGLFGSRNVTAWPIAEQLTPFTYGTLSHLVDRLIRLGPSVFCAFPTSMDLIVGAPGDSDHHPGDPVAVPNHPVPGLHFGALAPPDVPGEPVPEPLAVDGVEDRYCGPQLFASVDVPNGSTLRTSTVPVDGPEGQPPMCDASHVGTLDVTAVGPIDVAGTVEAAGGGRLSLTGEDVRIAGEVRGGAGPVVLQAARLLQVDGTVDAAAVITDSEVGGNAGDGHGGPG